MVVVDEEVEKAASQMHGKETALEMWKGPVLAEHEAVEARNEVEEMKLANEPKPNGVEPIVEVKTNGIEATPKA